MVPPTVAWASIDVVIQWRHEWNEVREKMMQEFNSKSNLLKLSVFALIVMVGVASRFWMIDWPNFKPIAALCLFAGFYFQSYFRAFAAGLLMLLISDFWIGGYEPAVATAVYLSMAVAGGLGFLIHRQLKSSDNESRMLGVTGWFRFVGASLVMSTTFFVLTNFAVWAFLPWYETSWSGLVQCFTAAIPFYRWTMMGDMTFTIVIVSTYQIACLVARSNSTNVAFVGSK